MNPSPKNYCIHSPLRRLFWAALVTSQLTLSALAQDGANAPVTAHAAVLRPIPRVVVVLAGGGAKGFAHLALLRRLEQDHIQIAKIIGTSMGAVIGGLYASGMSTEQIEKVIGSLDPGRVALDQLDRGELPHRAREYQQRYPVDLELGVQEGALTFARGVSDGQRFLALMQELTSNVAPNSSFDKLKIPFRAIATRYRDGELIAFDRGNLALVVRASMAAPGVFAPVEIDGETYVDGGLVANLPVEEALKEGADIIVASYLGDTEKPGEKPAVGNALSVATRMLDILMRQNELRNIGLLRPQDILVRPQLQDFNFGSFNQPVKIVKAGAEAVDALDARFKTLAQLASVDPAQMAQPTPNFTQKTIHIKQLRVTGYKNVTSAYILNALQPLQDTDYEPHVLTQKLDELYASGNFERVDYQLQQLADDQYELVVEVNEKTYGPNFVKVSLGLYSESSGTNLFSFGVGFRRPWLTPEGLELQLDARAGSQSEFSASLFQPLGDNWGLSGFVSYNSSELPLFRSDVAYAQKMALSTLRREEIGFNVSYDLSPKATAKIGLVANRTNLNIDTAKSVSFPTDGGGNVTYNLQDGQWEFLGLNASFTADQLDSPSFPTRGYYLKVQAAQGVTGTNQYTSFRINGLWAKDFGPHVINLGLDLGEDHIFDCAGCTLPTSLGPLYLGGFQSMGAYQMGQLMGDRLVHVHGTYMYLLTDGGILRQPTYVGFVAEAGDAWASTREYSTKYSGTAFIGVDSKIGDVFFGLASGSGGNRNVFIQLGRRFSLW